MCRFPHTECADYFDLSKLYDYPSALSQLEIGVARPESSKGVESPTPFEDSGRATQPKYQAVTEH